MSATTATVTPCNELEMKQEENGIGTGLDQFTSLITSPVSLWPVQSPLDAIFPSFINSYPNTPTVTSHHQFINSPIFQQTDDNQLPIIQPIQINNPSLDSNNNNAETNTLMAPMTPTFSMLYLPTSAVDSNNNGNILQTMMNMESINNFSISNNNNNINSNNNQFSENLKTENSMINNNANMFCNENIKTETSVIKSKRGRKRKIKQEDNYHEIPKPPAKKKRGRKKKINNKTFVHDGFIGIRTKDGEEKVSIPPDTKYPFEMFGDAITDKIEDILQPKGRTRYVRGLNENEKAERRREQNRNAAARSRARKNAMISKVIQLHQENLGLRAHIAQSISQKKELNLQIKSLQAMIADKK